MILCLCFPILHSPQSWSNQALYVWINSPFRFEDMKSHCCCCWLCGIVLALCTWRMFFRLYRSTGPQPHSPIISPWSWIITARSLKIWFTSRMSDWNRKREDQCWWVLMLCIYRQTNRPCLHVPWFLWNLTYFWPLYLSSTWNCSFTSLETIFSS